MTMEDLGEKIEKEIEDSRDYAESHQDSGDNYADCFCASEASDKALKAFLDSIELGKCGCSEDLAFDTALEALRLMCERNEFQMRPGSIWGVFDSAKQITLDFFAVGELECQLSDEIHFALKALRASDKAEDKEELEMLKRHFCLHISGHQTLAYESSNAVWFACISKASAISEIREALNNRLEDLRNAIASLPSKDKGDDF
jgi:hypothetical protein